jgi:hypothetical protein
VAKRKRGRPPHGEYPEKSQVMNFRIRPDTKRLLAQAARVSGRTVSAEAEHQLRRGLAEMGTGRTHAVMTTIGRAIDTLVTLKTSDRHGRDDQWWSDPRLFEAARRVVLEALELFRPLAADKAEANDSDVRQAAFEIEALLHEIQTVDENKPYVKQTPHERWLVLMKKDLGQLADRPAIWGMPAEQARELRDATVTLRRELAALLRKANEAAADFTPDERARLEELKSSLLEILQSKELENARQPH